MSPRRRRPRSGNRERSDPLNLRSVTFSEFLHFVTALNGGFVRRRSVRATSGDSVGDFLPVDGFEIRSAERVPFVTVSVDKGRGFLRCPAGRRKTTGGGGWWWGR